MKKRAFVLFFSIYMIIAMFTVITAVQLSGNSAKTASSTNRIDLIATNPFTPCSYEDYIYYGNPDTWVYPEAFVGSSAVFNLKYVNVDWEGWETFIIASKDEITEINTVDTEAEEGPYDKYDVVHSTDLMVDGESIKVVVTDYVLNVFDAPTLTGDLWFKVEAAEGYTLPAALQEKPYILHMTYSEDHPALMFPSKKSMFIDGTVTVSKQAVQAARTVDVSSADLPFIFDSNYFYSDGVYWYDLGDVSELEAITDAQYHYVNAVYTIQLPITVAHAYELLITSATSSEFNEHLAGIPDRVLASFSEALKEKVVAHLEELTAGENVEYNTTVKINGVEIGVAVKGKIPRDTVTLQASHVADFKTLADALGTEKATDIIVALDIKLINTVDGTVWQPEEGSPVELSIDMASLGYEDGTVVRLHHIHDDGDITTFDIFIVEDGKITLITDSFSIYAVQNIGDNQQNATQISPGTNNDRDITIYIGDEKIYYIVPNGDGYNSTRNPVRGTWVVTDTAGAIHYTVSSNQTSTAIGHNRVNARWISIVALKETPTNQPVTLTFRYVTSTADNAYVYSETYNLHIRTPRATSANGGRRLYIKDMVNTTGCITAALVDTNGNEINDKLAGAAFEWTRDDGLFIVPQAYSGDLNDPNAANDFRSVSIVQDHGGLVEARKKYQIDGNENSGVIGYKPVTYTLRATLSDGTVLTDSYTVYYQSEIINAGFEFPAAQGGTYNFFPNGYPELYWKTTAPGASSSNNDGDNLTKDIEYGSVVGKDEADYRVPKAASGNQFAELNAEELGALYQDIITVPGEYIDWEFMHAAREQQNNGVNRMFIVFGPTEHAQTLTTQTDLNGLGNATRDLVNGYTGDDAQKRTDFYDGKLGVEVEYPKRSGIKYTVWYHTVDKSKNSGTNSWVEFKGEYQAPANQYRTRVFFVTDTYNITGDKNYGNLIDQASAGQYKTYLVEYYEESYVTTTNPDGTTTSKLVIQYWEEKDEEGRALIYSSQPLVNFTWFETDQNDYLHSILINNRNYPYDIRYANTPSLYIEQYPGKGSNAVKRDDLVDENRNPITNTNDYSQYDIVVQVYFRDTVIAVQKELDMPTYNKTAGTEGMTEEQKLKLFDELVNSPSKGYATTFTLTSTPNNADFKKETETTLISKRDPAGKYTAAVALGNNPPLEEYYTVNELLPDDPKGLILQTVTFDIKRYYMGVSLDSLHELISHEVIKIDFEPGQDRLVSSSPIFLGMTDVDDNKDDKIDRRVSVKIADVKVTNTYIEKETTIFYEAVGNGKVAIVTDGVPNFQDTPTETLKFYSGKAKGADVFAGHGAKFVGWFKDPECTQKVELADGVVDGNNNFKPNSNIINAEKVTFYAKFETNSVTIERTNGTPGQIYAYKVEAINNGVTNAVMYVTVACGEDGTGSTEILEAMSGKYVVTEIGGWSWRSDAGVSPEKTEVFTTDSSGTENKNHITINFNGNVKKREWLNGFSESQKNVYSEGGGGSE